MISLRTQTESSDVAGESSRDTNFTIDIEAGVYKGRDSWVKTNGDWKLIYNPDGVTTVYPFSKEVHMCGEVHPLEFTVKAAYQPQAAKYALEEFITWLAKEGDTSS